ncbi:MAG TPA: polymer-forming cytoskeletal protein [Candidatus Acidoferrum sp.]|jgi:cytoskeletal protein CcmA (bactofilin family)
MWRKEEAKPQAAPQAPTPSTVSSQPTTVSAPASVPVSATVASATLPVSPRATACITQGIRIKGEITGKEDLFIDGALEGKLDLGNASVTIGPNGKVKADVSAREVVVRGQLDGKIDGTERVQLWNSGRVTGEVRTERLAIEDGALLRGKVEAGKAQSRGAENRSKAGTSDASDIGKSNTAAAASRTAAI